MGSLLLRASGSIGEEATLRRALSLSGQQRTGREITHTQLNRENDRLPDGSFVHAGRGIRF